MPLISGSVLILIKKCLCMMSVTAQSGPCQCEVTAYKLYTAVLWMPDMDGSEGTHVSVHVS